MSYLSFHPGNKSSDKGKKTKGSVRKAFSDYIIKNHGDDYKETLLKQRSKTDKIGLIKKQIIEVADPADKKPLVGIIGGGFAGLYAGLILQSLGIEFEIFEASDRVGGRIDTWYSADYDPKSDVNKGLYGEVGGMRVPQFSDDMLPVQHLALSLNYVLERNEMTDKMLRWRKFYYNSDYQRLRYNNMKKPIFAKGASLNSLNFGRNEGGDIKEVWVTEKTDENGNKYLPINIILDKVNGPFIDAINKSFETGFAKLMRYDNYSMWAYLTNVFTLADLEEYYDPAMGAPCENLSFNIASYLETTNVGTGMYSVSFVEMVIAVYDWDGSKNSYDRTDPNIYMITMNEGMQHFPDACRTVLNLENGVTADDGRLAQVLIGMAKGQNNEYGYSPPNLTEDAEPPSTVPPADPKGTANTNPDVSKKKKRVFMNHKVIQAVYDEKLYDNKGGMRLEIEHKHDGQKEELTKEYAYVISTLPNGAYLSGQKKTNFFDDLSFAKARALRECNYMPAFKAFITFNKQFWKEIGENRQYEVGLGVSASDRSNRQIVYPSYGFDAEKGVLQVYSWAQDAERMGALTDQQRVNECLKGIQFMYPEINIYDYYAGYNDGVTTKTWFWDQHAGGGAFALFNPGQFKNLYPTLLTPEFDGALNIAGECCSVHHGWIVGALDSAYNSVNNILEEMKATKSIVKMKAIWGGLTAPDVAIK
ncbi:FAD-dependent oxidoreductase [Kordia sp. YSTF-M3]|uniref:Tryptophan 2-monooxygenase n=1 Tax=Kordia aestuariivivens TaxID=2759037 RepID=A0ABR7Q9E9_9FLAO|nr:FAD-dependent oxidoreductase [Kordia aestuariivivens]MBC8754986.1 FAD-dependent oxidoreductase [Kordia aestuariivivens]